MEKESVTMDHAARVAEILECDVDQVRLAQYPEEKLTSIFDRMVRAERIGKYVSVPAGLALFGILGLSAFIKDPEIKDAMIWPAAPAGLIYVASKLMDGRPRLRQQIERDALAEGVKLFKQQNPQP